MHSSVKPVPAAGPLIACAVGIVAALTGGVRAGGPQTAPAGVQQVDLAGQLAAGRLRAVNREVSALPEKAGAVRVAEKADNGVVWIEGTDFAQGTIELEIRGRDLTGQSFVGVAFHRQDDGHYEAVYLRPFNFRAEDPVRHQHAVQYIAAPDWDWPRLRKEFPEEFENPVDKSIEPTGWVPVRIVVNAKTVQIYVGTVTAPTLEVRKLGTVERGQIGLWAGNGSDGAYANLRIRPSTP